MSEAASEIQVHATLRPRSVRNLVIFSCTAVGAGWLGLALDRALEQAPGQGPGMLLWLVVCFAVVLGVGFALGWVSPTWMERACCSATPA